MKGKRNDRPIINGQVVASLDVRHPRDAAVEPHGKTKSLGIDRRDGCIEFCLHRLVLRVQVDERDPGIQGSLRSRRAGLPA